jgi:RNA polymerase sigma-70 factor (ECF subfamily)
MIQLPAATDDALMLAYAAGDARAFEQLYQRHQAALYRFVCRVLGSALAAQADEVFQDCWLRIIQAAERYEAGRASFKTWAFAIAHNLALDRLRLSGREVDVQGDAACAWEPLEAASAAAGMLQVSSEDAAHWRAAGRRLAHCLDALPEAQRAAFLLHHEEGLSVPELAAQLGMGFESAKSRLRYAMTKLRECMGAHLDGVVRP